MNKLHPLTLTSAKHKHCRRKEHKAEEQQTQKEEVSQRTANPLESEMTVQTAGDDSEENEETKGARLGFDFTEDLFG